mgnify:CR=1 FL=1
MIKSHSINKVLVVGLGSIGKRRIRIINKIFPEVSVDVLRHKKCNIDQNDSLKISQCFTSLDKAIKAKPQVAIISNPASKHITIAKKLANHGINLMLEKPIADNSKESLELIDICNQKNVMLTIAYNLRFLPSLLHFQKCVQSRIVGNFFSIRSEAGQYLPSWRPESDYRDGVSAQKSLGGGVLLELSHEIDYLQWIFGSISWVQANTSRQSNLEIDVDDNASIILGFKSKNDKELVASLNLDFIRHDLTRRCYLIGEKGTLLWDGVSGKVKLFLKNDNYWKELFQSCPDKNYTYEQEIISFFNAIESQDLPVVSGEDGVNSVLAIEAIEESSFSGSKVYI